VTPEPEPVDAEEAYRRCEEALEAGDELEAAWWRYTAGLGPRAPAAPHLMAFRPPRSGPSRRGRRA
jgi:hypothetical protein